MPHDFTTTGTTDDDLDLDLIDPDLDGLDVDSQGSDYDDVASELAAVVTPTTVLAVEGRPGYAVRYRIDFSGKDLDLLRKRAKDRKFIDGIDGVKFAALLLATTAQAVTRKGTDLDLDTGGPVTFTTPAFQQMLGTATAVETIRKFYGLDGHVDAAARRLMTDAGWGDDAVDGEDPTA